MIDKDIKHVPPNSRIEMHSGGVQFRAKRVKINFEFEGTDIVPALSRVASWLNGVADGARFAFGRPPSAEAPRDRQENGETTQTAEARPRQP